MPDDPNLTPTLTSTESDIIQAEKQDTSTPATTEEAPNSPLAPEATDGQAPLTTASDTTETAPEVQNAPTEGFIPVPVETIPLEPTDVQANPASNGTSEPSVEPVPEPQTAQILVSEPLTQDKPSLARQLLISARNAIQFRKRKKLDKVMALFLQKSKITNAEVQKLLHVSDATATRYLSELEREGKIKQNGKTGEGVSYFKI